VARSVGVDLACLGGADGAHRHGSAGHYGAPLLLNDTFNRAHARPGLRKCRRNEAGHNGRQWNQCSPSLDLDSCSIGARSRCPSAAIAQRAALFSDPGFLSPGNRVVPA